MHPLMDLFRSNELADRLRRDVGRSVLRARNGVRHVAGVDRAQVGLSPKDTVWQRDQCQLWHYRREGPPTAAPPILLVMSLVSRSYVLDLRPGNSVVEFLLGEGFDVYMLDWGIPQEVDSHNTLETYADDYLPDAARAVCRDSGRGELTVWGYCFGGVLSLLSVAGNPDLPVRNLLVMATPTDFSRLGPMWSMLQRGRVEPEQLIDDRTGNVPPGTIFNSLKMLKPTSDLTSIANLVDNLWNDQFLEGYQAMSKWTTDHIPFPGACFRQTAELFTRDNQLVTGRIRLQDRTVELRDITVPFLNVIGELDHIVPLDAVTPLVELVGSADATELRLPAGHAGLVVGRSAHKRNLPAMAAWVRAHSDEIGVPAEVADGS
jgi:polyhydroxyalkanoate synthase subunit PhaC